MLTVFLLCANSDFQNFFILQNWNSLLVKEQLPFPVSLALGKHHFPVHFYEFDYSNTPWKPDHVVFVFFWIANIVLNVFYFIHFTCWYLVYLFYKACWLWLGRLFFFLTIYLFCLLTLLSELQPFTHVF